VPQVLLDYPVVRLYHQIGSTAGDTGGYAFQFTGVPVGYTWRVDRLSAILFAPDAAEETNEVAEPVVTVFDQQVSNLAGTTVPVDITQLAVYQVVTAATWYVADFADYAAPITVRGGDQLTVVFSPGGHLFAVGQVLAVRAQYQLFQGVPGQSQPVAGAQAGPPISPSL